MNFLDYFKKTKTKEEFISFGHGVTFRHSRAMPNTMPDGLVFYYHKDGSMKMSGTTIRIDIHSSHYSTYYANNNVGYSFSVTAKELEELYQVFQHNQFHKIESDGETLPDIQGETLSLQWQDQCITISQGRQGKIKKEYITAFRNCVNAIELLAEKDYARHLRKMSVQMDETIRKEFKFSLYSEELTRKKNFQK